MTWTILYGIVCATLAYSLVRLAWYNIPWAGIAVFLFDCVRLFDSHVAIHFTHSLQISKVIGLLWQVTLVLYRCLYNLLLAARRLIADMWAGILSYIRITLLTLIYAPVDDFQLPPYPRVPTHYKL